MKVSRVLATALAVAAPVAPATAGTMQIAWSTDLTGNEFDGWTTGGNWAGGTFGPDGPWQAVSINLGNSKNGKGFMWPNGAGISYVLTAQTGGNYSTNTTTARRRNTTISNEDEWSSSLFYNTSFYAEPYFETLSLAEKTSQAITVNASIGAMYIAAVNLPDGRNFTPGVGILGLGPDDIVKETHFSQPSILAQLKAAKSIGSNSFGLHMGSVPYNQAGSLVFGGYEQNRVLGTVGVNNMISSNGVVPTSFLMEVALGVEVGSSPFNQSGNITMFQGIDSSQKQSIAITRELGGPTGAAVMIPNPASPYMYMPLGVCEKAAQYLPVLWNSDLDLYTWNTADPQYNRIVSSPAHIAFTFADRSATNFTIKVPFQLLNLTLLPPLTEVPTPYFPCKPYNASLFGYWQLGRAFLQAAFLGINYEQNVSFLAQAPGPTMDPSNIQAITTNSTQILSNSVDAFARSWSSTWTVLNSTDNSTTAAVSSGLSTGAIAGISVGSVLGGLAIIGAAVFACCRRRKREKAQELPAPAMEHVDRTDIDSLQLPDSDSGTWNFSASSPYKSEATRSPSELHSIRSPHELDATMTQELDSATLQELYGAVPQELHAPPAVHEAPGFPYHELSASPAPRYANYGGYSSSSR